MSYQPIRRTKAPPIDPEGQLQAAVLAAGGSRRLGQAKQLLRFRGTTLLEHAVALASATCGARTRVVLGARAEAMTALLDEDIVSVIVNEDWQSGMAGSLNLAVDSLPADCAGLLVLVCDQPLLEASHIHSLARLWARNRDAIVASSYAGTVGVPAIFPARLFGQLRALSGDEGARHLIRGEGNAVRTIAIPEAAFDVDDKSSLTELARLDCYERED